MAQKTNASDCMCFDPTPILDWLSHNGYLVADNDAFLTEFANQLLAAGLAVERMTVSIPILHPQIAGHSYLWKVGESIEGRTFPATEKTLRQMEASPVRAAFREGKDTRYRIPPQPVDGEYAIYADLREEGYTDHATFAVSFSDNTHKAITIATRTPEGFSDGCIKAFADLMTPLAPLLEVRSLKLMSRALLDVYIGPTAGSRVMNGEVHRGDGENIQAVIWFSDLRNSTQLSNQLNGQEMISHLNEFFSIVTCSITEHGGEVLKFIGDSVLAIFPCHSIVEVGCMAAHQAEMAATDAISRTEAHNTQAIAHGERPIDFGIALHIGEVFYGNVGGDDRLDFTVIGPAVSMASRIESATKETLNPLLVSPQFARISNSLYTQVGSFDFNGVEGWTSVFAPAQVADLTSESAAVLV